MKHSSNTSKRIIQILLFFGTIISLYFVPWQILIAWIAPLEESVQEEVNKAIDHGFDGIIVYIDQKGENPHWYTAGWHNREKAIPARADALFKIASIGKLYDAVTVTKLIHAGKLDLQKTITDYFPELESRIQYADQITLAMLVQHRSGIPNYTDTPNFWVDPPKSQQGLLELILDQPALFKPDSEWAYSNTNYLLLNMLIEKVTYRNKFDYMKEVIFNPLGLKRTYASIHQLNEMDSLMSGYYVGIENDIKEADYGSMISSAEEVGIFLRALNEKTIFNGEESTTYNSLYVYNHTGLIPGYQSIAKYHSELDAVVIQFTNTTNFNGYNWNLSEIIYNRIISVLEKG